MPRQVIHFGQAGCVPILLGIVSEPRQQWKECRRGALSNRQERPAIRVVIADDHALFRKGVHAALDPEPTVEIVGAVKSFRDLMSLLETNAADVVLLDLGGMGLPAVSAVTSLARSYPEIAIIIFSSSLSGARELLRQGARGYVAKEDVEDEVLTAIHTVVQGKQFLSPVVNDYLARSGGRRKSQGITPREWDVLRLNAEGYSTDEIADQLRISYHAVGNLISTLYSKTGCTTRTQLADCYRRMAGPEK